MDDPLPVSGRDRQRVNLLLDVRRDGPELVLTLGQKLACTMGDESSTSCF